MNSLSGISSGFSTKAVETMSQRGVSADVQNSFRTILDQATASGEKAESFLSSLSRDDLTVIQKIHDLAEDIKVRELNEEGAHNLLSPPGEAADLNNDSFLQIGKAMTKTFPPPNATQTVHDAWNQTMAGRSKRDQLLAEMMFMPLELSANLITDTNGNVTGIRSPHDNNWVNIYADSEFTYGTMLDQYAEYLEIAKMDMVPGQYDKCAALMNDFRLALKTRGIGQ